MLFLLLYILATLKHKLQNIAILVTKNRKRLESFGKANCQGREKLHKRGKPSVEDMEKMQRRVLKSSSFITQVKDRAVDEVWRIYVVDRGD